MRTCRAATGGMIRVVILVFGLLHRIGITDLSAATEIKIGTDARKNRRGSAKTVAGATAKLADLPAAKTAALARFTVQY